MERESFENDEIAEFINEHFVSIKVDREERPDIDGIYMTFVQATSGHGGWPLSVFLTPDLKPFYGGTYFPPEDSVFMPGFKTLLQRLAFMWSKSHDKLLSNANSIAEQLAKPNRAASNYKQGSLDKTATSISMAKATDCFLHFRESFDEVHGGFGRAPKFPTPVTFNFLFRFAYFINIPTALHDRAELEKLSEAQLKRIIQVYDIEGDVSSLDKSSLVTTIHDQTREREILSSSALKCALTTLKKIAQGGIHDHVGSGFHRYSVTEDWLVPHFEKMLYDQAQLLHAFLDAAVMDPNQDPLWVETVKDILLYVNRDLWHEEGGYYSAEDADSVPFTFSKETMNGEESKSAKHGAVKKEGAFAVWEHDEIALLLGSELDSGQPNPVDIFCHAYGVQRQGNVPSRYDTHNELHRKNILSVKHSVEETAAHFGISTTDVSTSLARSRAKLYELRTKYRPRPHLDDKIITSWNGLMISALARAYQILDDGHALERAIKTASFIHNNLYNPTTKRLKRSYRHGPSAIDGVADDYAFLIMGLLELYTATSDYTYLSWAMDLQKSMDEQFFDSSISEQDPGIPIGGYFDSKDDDPSVIMRLKEDHDGAEPAASSVAVNNLLRMSSLIPGSPLGREYRDKALQCFRAFWSQLDSLPFTMPMFMSGWMTWSRAKRTNGSMKQVVIAYSNLTDGEPLLEVAMKGFYPDMVLHHFADPKAFLNRAGDDDFTKFWKQHHAVLFDMLEKAIQEEKPLAFVCQGTECGLPVSDPDALKDKLVKSV